jgi:hypothetical protein
MIEADLYDERAIAEITIHHECGQTEIMKNVLVRAPNFRTCWPSRVASKSLDRRHYSAGRSTMG